MESSRYQSAYERGQVGSFSSSGAWKHNSDKNPHAAPSAETTLPLCCKFPASVVFCSLTRDSHVAEHLCDSPVMCECTSCTEVVLQKKEKEDVCKPIMSFTICFMNICEYGPSYLHLLFQFISIYVTLKMSLLS